MLHQECRTVLFGQLNDCFMGQCNREYIMSQLVKHISEWVNIMIVYLLTTLNRIHVLRMN